MSLVDPALKPLPPLLPGRLEMTRTFDAPRPLVWAAWTRPEMRVGWMGPVEWPMVSGTNDLRVGGEWRACLRSVETGEDLWQGGHYREIDEPRRLVFTFKWDESHEDGPPVDTQVSIDFSETEAGKTLMDFTHEGLKSERSVTGHTYGWTSTMDRLDAWLLANPD